MATQSNAASVCGWNLPWLELDARSAQVDKTIVRQVLLKWRSYNTRGIK